MSALLLDYWPISLESGLVGTSILTILVIPLCFIIRLILCELYVASLTLMSPPIFPCNFFVTACIGSILHLPTAFGLIQFWFLAAGLKNFQKYSLAHLFIHHKFFLHLKRTPFRYCIWTYDCLPQQFFTFYKTCTKLL